MALRDRATVAADGERNLRRLAAGPTSLLHACTPGQSLDCLRDGGDVLLWVLQAVLVLAAIGDSVSGQEPSDGGASPDD